MSPSIASLVCVLGILGLFWLDRDRKSRTSKALWLPVTWLLICESRAVSQWLGSGPAISSVEDLAEGSPLDRNVLMALLACGTAVLVRRGPQVDRLLRGNWPVLSLYAYYAISVFWSDYPGIAFKHWVKAVGDLVMVVVILTELDWPGALRRVVARTAFVLIPISILFVKYYPGLGIGYDYWVGTPSYTGVTTDKNLLGMTCLVSGLGCLWRCLELGQPATGQRRLDALFAHGACLAMVIWLLWKANSATSKASFVLAGGLMAVTYLFSLARTRAVLHVLVVGLVSAVFSALFLDLGSSLVESIGRDSTLTGRTEVWDRVLGMVQNPLLGCGYDSFWLGSRLESLWSIYWWRPNEAHNGYIDFYLNLGWVGLSLLALVAATGYGWIVAAVGRREEASNLRLAYLIAAIVYNFTEAAFKKQHPIGIFFLLAVIAIPKLRVQRAKDKLRYEDPVAADGALSATRPKWAWKFAGQGEVSRGTN